jgi:hypothetical protein
LRASARLASALLLFAAMLNLFGAAGKPSIILVLRVLFTLGC